jgi:hypothetical protein
VRHYGRWLADRIVGAKLGASSHRCQAMLSPFKRSISLLDLALSHTERHRATGRTSFACRLTMAPIEETKITHLVPGCDG